MTTQTWEIAEQHFPTAPIHLEFNHAQTHTPFQFAYLCPHCGNVWARRRIAPATRWLAVHRGCAACGRQETFTRPGSIMQDWDHSFRANLPREVLEYELLLSSPVFLLR